MKKCDFFIEEQSREAIRSGLFSHIYIEAGFLKEGKERWKFTEPPNNRTVFDLASLTKALVTTPLIFKEIENQGLDLFSATVRELFPGVEEKTHLEENLLKIKVFSLLNHSSGLPAWKNFWVNFLSKDKKSQKEINKHLVTIMNRAAREISEKKEPVYSDLGFILLGFCLEQKHGKDLSTLFNEFCLTDLNFDPVRFSLGYARNLLLSDTAVPTAFCKIREQRLIGEVHDENCAALGGVSGHAGLFGTGEGVSHYLRRLLKTEIGQNIFFQNSSLRKPPPNKTLCGWMQNNFESSETFFNGRAIGHLGFTGTSFWIYPEGSMPNSILLTNRVLNRRNNVKEISDFRRKVFSSLSEYYETI